MTQDTEDVVAAIIDHYADSGDVSREQLIEQIVELIATDRQSLSDRIDVMREQTLLVDRLCSAVDQASEDIGHESIDGLLKLIGPQNELCIEALGGRAALHQEDISRGN